PSNSSQFAPPDLHTHESSGSPAVTAGFYRVNPGDTLNGVARAFGREPSALAQWNHLPPDGGLLVGQVLRVAPPVAARGQGSDIPADMQGGVSADTHGSVPESPRPPAVRTARLAWPAGGPLNAPFVAGRTKGIVIGGDAGEQVKAASAGRVVYAGGHIATYGQLIIIKHDAHLLTAYGSNRALLVKEGAVVKRGEVIAEMGADPGGRASLRFEVREDGKPVDPLKYLPNRQ
ncbi:MAG TPA: peptidoglycan DD-metalloendopeptidase family protein, partial [Paraburkholderia sp.]|nr:peptidoglycan DD-metalloendopeptidase family protein [Paraburkholderia sp.]